VLNHVISSTIAARHLPSARFARYEGIDRRAFSACPAVEGGAVKLVVTAIVVAFVLFYVMTSPDQAANIVQGTWAIAVNVAHGVGSFINKLVS
jgi:hypothetical protein